ncbi:MAG: metallophosphoesterase family protein [Clostridiales bacterium]|nr:metallophosphoesterase family protein [Clostridiales bacterium]
MRYYISDTHFFHENLNFRMDNRGFADVEAMNTHMIRQWNSRVRKKDEVVVLGDFSFGKSKETEEILKQLNGRKCLVEGNHDYYLSDKSFDRELFLWVKPYAEMHDEGRKVVLSHYPIICYNGQFHRDNRGNPRTYMLYGHVHNSYDEVLVNRFIGEMGEVPRPLHGCDHEVVTPCQMINCFCMFSDYVPLTLTEWIEVDRKRRETLTKMGYETPKMTEEE